MANGVDDSDTNNDTNNDGSDALWRRHAEEWRDPASVVGFVGAAPSMHPGAFEHRVTGPWWDLLHELQVGLLVSREYEHLLVSLAAPQGRPQVTFLQAPHPSGIAVNSDRSVIHVACTRNPNQVLELRPAAAFLERDDAARPDQPLGTLVPASSRYYPGSLYMHDLAVINGELYANAVGHNAVVRLPESGGIERVWWPTCIDGPHGPDFRRNHVQLNSIAAGATIEDSWFTASGAIPGELPPGHPDYPVDGRGVVFDGRTREPRVRGLTRPHSARLRGDELWLANSGYGEVRRVCGLGGTGWRDAEIVTRVPGWTRGLALLGDIVVVGTSRVIPRFSQYAPGLEEGASQCGLHALDTRSGEIVASLEWPVGNQIFAVEAVPLTLATGLPGTVDERGVHSSTTDFYYSAMIEEM